MEGIMEVFHSRKLMKLEEDERFLKQWRLLHLFFDKILVGFS